MGAGKIVVPLVSLILLVGVIVGVVVVVHQNGEKKDDQNTKVQMKKVQEICQPVSFKDACERSLESTAKNESATLKDYLQAAFTSTMEEIRKGYEEAKKTNVNNDTDPYNHMGIEDCKMLLEYAIEELEDSLSVIDESDMNEVNERGFDFLIWLSTVYAHQTTCLDSIDNNDLKASLEKALDTARQLTSNALDIVAKLSDFFQQFDLGNLIKPNDSGNAAHRRLLDVNKVDQDGYPAWFPVADRKLLGKGGKGKGKGKGKGDGTGVPLAPLGNGPITPHAVVAKDGSGKFKTVNDAIKAYPPNHQGRYIIYVKAGIYEEQVMIDKPQPNVFIYGDGAAKTIITCDKNYGRLNIQTMHTATFAVQSFGFIAKGITFRNSAGPDGHQAVALRIMADNAVVVDCNIEGYQDTLYYQTGKQFYRNCVIAGTLDFIFGNGAALIQDSTIIVRKPNDNQKNTITADGRQEPSQPTGVVIQNCKIVADQAFMADRMRIPTYLNRPWKKFSTNVFMESELPDFINPEGYMIFEVKKGDPPNRYEETAEVAEYANRGPGAATDKRSKLFKKFRVLNAQEAAKYTAANFIGASQWLPGTSAPYYLGLGGK